jgi:hypothetical protein
MVPEEPTSVEHLVAANRTLGEECRDSLNTLYAEVKALRLLVEALLDPQPPEASPSAMAPSPQHEGKA